MNVNINEVKAQLSKYIELVEAGETVVICKRNIPVAEMRPIPKTRRQSPVLGSAAGTFIIPQAFFEPLPDDLLDSFEGRPGEGPKR
jgi:antitoxin (DNA-binding transcriptional repressor) of toxin-antitoxin stability system